jgi:hypothetical protein
MRYVRRGTKSWNCSLHSVRIKRANAPAMSNKNNNKYQIIYVYKVEEIYIVCKKMLNSYINKVTIHGLSLRY